MSQRAVYIEMLELQLEELNKKMLRLEATAQQTTEDARQKYKEEMGRLRQQSKVAVAKLDELKTASVDSWGSLVTGMEKMNDAFKHSFYSIFQTPSTREPATRSAKTGSSTTHTTA